MYSFLEATLLNLNKGQPTLVSSFEEKQGRHVKNCVNFLQKSYMEILENIRSTYRFFTDHPKEIQVQWRKVLYEIDLTIEKSLKHCVKASLQEFNRGMNGDGKNEPSPLFKISMILDPRSSRVQFTPTILELSQMISAASKQITESCKNIFKVSQKPHQNVSFADSSEKSGFYDVLAQDNEIVNLYVSIMEGMSTKIF